jgi:DNA-binding transcriptional regulator of glucitol operon
MVHLAQTVHLSCTDTNTVSKQTEMRFQMTHITEGFHRVRQKGFLRLWYVRRKLCTYLASRLALSLNDLKQACT